MSYKNETVLNILIECEDDTSFTTVFYGLCYVTNRVETSFSSKLIATINPEMPVYDKWVKENLGFKEPYSGMASEKRKKRFIKIYSELQEKTLEITRLSDFGKLRMSFDQAFPQYECFTDIKKLDLFLWQARLASYPLIPCVLQLKEIGNRINEH